MATPRFYCAHLAPGIVELDEAESGHALGSLRLRPGDEVILFDGRGRVAHANLLPQPTANGKRARIPRTAGRRTARLEVARVLCEPPPQRTLTLIAAGCKGPRLTWMVEKLTELATTAILLVNFERSVVRVGPAHADRLRRTALQAAKQSQRAWLPQIACGADPADTLRDHSDALLLVAHPGSDSVSLTAALHRSVVHPDVVAIVGPEGGLTEAEIDYLRSHAGILVRLAPTILRVETAAVAIAANWAAHQPAP